MHGLSLSLATLEASLTAYIPGPMYFDLNYTGGLPKLIDNPHSWTKVCNIIFLDSPAGTGFSYSNTTADYVYGEFKIVSDAYAFLIKWFEAYPEFLSNPLYIGGDSYSGLIVPMLTQKIADGIEAGAKPLLNIKGYLVGNGETDYFFDNAQVPFGHGMALISDEIYETTKQACNGNYTSTNPSCQSKVESIYEQFFSHLNKASILDPSCYPITMKQEKVSGQKEPGKGHEKLEVLDQLNEARRKVWSTRFTVHDGFHRIPLHFGYEDKPCPSLDKYNLSDIWAKSPFVRKTIHALPENITGVWKRCTPRFKYKRDVTSVIIYHKNLTKRGYRALIYSGDHDLVIPYVGTEAWVRSLGYSIVEEWRSWFVDGQVAGYTRAYNHNLTFATVKGAGHTAPEYKPREAFSMFISWIFGKPF
ncbi:serine carboxypeptidase 1-like isoform X2 [Cryptomeria japonica]|uniref:serine carboxypeptidase 1-like isoform X2 n=1 Tax=Cryptomeria japonica TaxID=3369 RepID=UPI0027DA2DA9|nr:serine carboxypeptidase 1-like isoform X2 [Cryptomeria japonica]